jgi:iron-regulated transporter 1
VLGALEVWCAQRIAHQNSHLRLPKVAFIDEGTADDFNAENKHKGTTPGHAAWLQKLFAAIYHDPLSRLQQYFSMSIWPASTSISLLQMTVLAYSATLITYLLEVGFSLSAVTIARGSGSIMALAGTFITPIAVQRLRNRKSRAYRPSVDKVYDLAEYEGTIIRTVGIWGVSSQFLCMVSYDPLS